MCFFSWLCVSFISNLTPTHSFNTRSLNSVFFFINCIIVDFVILNNGVSMFVFMSPPTSHVWIIIRMYGGKICLQYYTRIALWLCLLLWTVNDVSGIFKSSQGQAVTSFCFLKKKILGVFHLYNKLDLINYLWTTQFDFVFRESKYLDFHERWVTSVPFCCFGSAGLQGFRNLVSQCSSCKTHV